MTFLVERLAELRRHLDHLVVLRPRVPNRDALERDLSLRSEVLFSLLSRRGNRFEDYTEAVRLLWRDWSVSLAFAISSSTSM